MRDVLVKIGMFLMHAADVAWHAVLTGAVTAVGWLGVGWLVILAAVTLLVALWGLRVHRG